MSALLEIAVFNLESALVAAHAGADRLELCDGYSVGGVTPSIDTLREAGRLLTIPFFVMIRPRGGDFCYNKEELEVMRESLLAAKAAGAHGFVFGILTAAGAIDVAANKELVQLAAPLPCTFHRAFDDLDDKVAALETLIDCGFKRVLTSGGDGPAEKHLLTIKALVHHAAGRIIVMPGGGIRPGNIHEIRSVTAAEEYHSAAIAPSNDLVDAPTVARLKEATSA